MKTLRSLIETAAILFTVFEMAYAGWSEPIPVDSINGVIDDYYPSISPDDGTLYFTTGNRIRISHWTGSTWSTSVDAGNNINSGQRQVKATVTPDNRTLYFTSYKSGGYGSYDIWKSEWQDTCNCWGVPSVMPPPLNTEFMEWDVQLTHDGRRMYFSSDRHFSWGDLDIWYSDWNDSTQTWGEPVNPGLTVNSSSRDYGAYPSLDGTKLYFASWNPHHFEPPQWLGPVDLFVAYNRGNGWDSVAILPPPIMTGYWETSPAISDDGMTLYFASTRPGGPGWTDIYVSHNTTAIEGGSDKTEDGRSLMIFPNPSNGEIIFVLNGKSSDASQTNRIKLTIFNLLGQKVAQLSIDFGRQAQWNCRDLLGNEVTSGLYLALIETPGKSISEKFSLIR